MKGCGGQFTGWQVLLGMAALTCFFFLMGLLELSLKWRSV